MCNERQTRRRLTEHCQQYPYLQPEDIFKFLYQSTFGCEHMLSSLPQAIEWIRQEDMGERIDAEWLDGGYARVHLGCLNQGLSPKTLGTLFYLSAQKQKGEIHHLQQRLEVARELAGEGKLPFSEDVFNEALTRWEREGHPAVHHSEAFRAAYQPHYRVIAAEYIPFLPLFMAIDGLKEGAVIAIEGGSGAGKTTLASLLERVYDCRVFHMDDFFLRPEQRTEERLSEIGGNADRERFREEVLIPAVNYERVCYRPYDCMISSLRSAVTVEKKPLTVVEGAYCMHPELAEYYDLSVFLEMDEALQKERIHKRNSPQMAERFFTEWVPMEREYFSETQVKERCTLSIKIEK